MLYSIDDQMIESMWPSLAEGVNAIDYTIDKVPDGDYETVIWEN